MSTVDHIIISSLWAQVSHPPRLLWGQEGQKEGWWPLYRSELVRLGMGTRLPGPSSSRLGALGPWTPQRTQSCLLRPSWGALKDWEDAAVGDQAPVGHGGAGTVTTRPCRFCGHSQPGGDSGKGEEQRDGQDASACPMWFITAPRSSLPTFLLPHLLLSTARPSVMPRRLEWMPMPLPCLDVEAEALRSENLPQGHTKLRSRRLPVHRALTWAVFPRGLVSPTPPSPLWPSVLYTDRPCNWEQAPTPLCLFPVLQNEEAGPDQGSHRCCGGGAAFPAVNSRGNSGGHTHLRPCPGEGGSEPGPARVPSPSPKSCWFSVIAALAACICDQLLSHV